MVRVSIGRVVWGVVIGSVLLCPSAVAGDQVKRLFIVHSYEEGQVCGQPQHDGVLKALNEAGWTVGQNLVLNTYYMDTKKTYTTPEQMAARGRKALELIEAFKPDAVVTLDDNAARTVMLPLVGSDIPVVFCGMNGQPEAYNAKQPFMASRALPGANVTGVYEKLHVCTSIRVLQSVLPGMKRVLAITDYSPTGNAITVQLERELSQGRPAVAWEIVRVKDVAEFQDLILNRVNTDPAIGAIYSIALRIEGPGGTMNNAPEVYKWQIANCTKPSMALNYFFAKLGLFGGAAVDFVAMGHQTGNKVAAIFNGAKAGDLPIEDARKYAIVFNTARARELSITIPFEMLGAADFVYDTIALKATTPDAAGKSVAGRRP